MWWRSWQGAWPTLDFNRCAIVFGGVAPAASGAGSGCGINTGVAAVGFMGLDQYILNYTVFGREVKLASQLEGVSSRGRIVISEATRQQLERNGPALVKTCVPLPLATVKDIRAAVNICGVAWRMSAHKSQPP